ncbi:hypothetical protein FE391_41380 [Nonomuraea sp. KC401]|uniref:hypothetical protein n=1 Tax=unclassified Nonomuraea TaxID=2593643 RepID=UPI0010FD1374|nr:MULTISPECIES: hypothetical protein [unclassified Nonomuraea]NBE98291.1 hypothetical protein [Nonomuraea sp. K271]TLF54800.1 hypothetical protein FE391_41380 [Nonomuraea sp. KC401]
MEIDRPRINLSAEAFEIEAGDLAGYAAMAGDELDAIGNFWGEDKEGVTFFKGQGGGMGYEAVTGQVMKGLGVFHSAHSEVATRLRMMAGNVTVADWESVAAVLVALPPPDPGKPVWGTL